MTAVPTPTITIFFGLPASGGDWFTLDDPVKGLLDGSYPLAGDIGTVVTDFGFDLSTHRGRARWLDDNEVGTCTVAFRNHTRIFDPLHSDPSILVDENGDGFVDEDESALLTPFAPYYGQLRPGKRVKVEIEGATIFDGTTERWDVSYTPGGDAASVLSAEDALGALGRREFDEWTSTEGDLPGERIASVLNRSDVGFGSNRDIDDGVNTLQSDLVTWGSNVLNYLQLVAKSDLGNFYASRDGVLTFRDRRSRFGANVAMAFSDVGLSTTVFTADDGPVTVNEAPFVDLRLESGSTMLFNRVGVDRVDGILQTAEDTQSQSEVGIRSLNLSGILLDSDTQSENMAGYLLGLHRVPKERVSSITVNMARLDAAQRALVARLDMDDLISVRVTPLGIGVAIDQLLYVEGVDHAVPYGGPHLVTLSLSLADSAAPFTLDHATLGLLNGAGVLAY